MLRLHHMRWIQAAPSAAILVSLALVLVTMPARAQDAEAPIPGSATIPPGGTVRFAPSTPPGVITSNRLTVVNQSDAPATVAVDSSGVTITVPAGRTVQVVEFAGQEPVCTPTAAGPNVVRCTAPGSPAGGFLSFTTVQAIPASGATERVPLMRGCNAVTSTFRNATPASVLAEAVAPAAALQAIWRYDNATRRFQAYSPRAAAVSDLQRVDRIDTLYICMVEPGTWERPAL